ncbi:hypothetical protein [Halonotius sp. GCM10025705]|uniref:hypothetical protein n=1 Tax=Halonotius sp. GCM10025705 TaxID=3252678 RepID=UPI00361D906A
MVLLADSEREWQTITTHRIVGVTAVAIGIAGQVHAWKAGALLVTPLAVYVPFRVFSDLRAQRSPATANVWLLTGLGLASFSAAFPYVLFGWSGSVRSITPLLLFIGSLTLVGLGVVAKRREIDATTVFVGEILGGIILGALLWIASPDVRSAVTGGVSQIVRLSDSNIVESMSLFSLESGFIITPIYYLGFSFLFALVGLFWVTYRQRYAQTPAILVLIIYAWVLFVYGIVQLRFAAQFGIVAAVFASVAFVQALSYVDLTTGVRKYMEPISAAHTRSKVNASSGSFRLPDIQVLAIILALFVLVGVLVYSK